MSDCRLIKDEGGVKAALVVKISTDIPFLASSCIPLFVIPNTMTLSRVREGDSQG